MQHFRQATVANVAWSIWKDRNELIFQSRDVDPRQIIKRGLVLTIERFKPRLDICAQEEDQLFWNDWGYSGVKTKQDY